MKLGDQCPFCRKAIAGYELGKWSSSTGAAGLWPTSLKNLSELARNDGFNDYFRDVFNGNEVRSREDRSDELGMWYSWSHFTHPTSFSVSMDADFIYTLF